MRACWLKWVGRDWSISADYIWLNYSDANNTKVGQSNKQDATAMMAQQDNRHECADLHGKPINRVGKCLVAVLISVLRSNPSPDS